MRILLTDAGGRPAPGAARIARAERALGWHPETWRPAAPGRGGPVNHWIVAGAEDQSAFLKFAPTPHLAAWLRAERRTVEALVGSFLPRIVGWDDDGTTPLLALEDLSAADWPPPWPEARVAAVLDLLTAVAATPPPDHLEPVAPAEIYDWAVVAADPGPFLALGVCSAAWLSAALPVLQRAAAAAPLAGGALVHLDVRSDNLCFDRSRTVLLDWNHAGLGNPDLDIAFWLPSLQAEGGPAPESILRDAPELAAWVAGFFASQAGLPPIPTAPHVRPLQLAQLRTALPWAARALRLPSPQMTVTAMSKARCRRGR